MPRRLRVLEENAIYHVYNRGVDKKIIFIEDNDFIKFMSLLNETYHARNFFIYSYCLMHNHYHLMIEANNKGLSEVMQKVNWRYATYFNKKYKRTGVLFESRFKSILVQKNIYALTLAKYIHLNPIEAGLSKDLSEWTWSSYKIFTSDAPQPIFFNKDFILDYFQKNKQENFIDFHHNNDEFYYIDL